MLSRAATLRKILNVFDLYILAANYNVGKLLVDWFLNIWKTWLDFILFARIS
jgi:hypothetical protein